MILPRLSTIRGQLVLLYLGVLAILLFVLGVVQSVTLTQYLRSTTAMDLRHATSAELRVLGPCFITSQTELNQNAQTLARLLGSRSTAVKIVTRSGETLADHGFGPPGASHPLQLSAETIRRLIRSTSSETVSMSPDLPSPCQPLSSSGGGSTSGTTQSAAHDREFGILTQGNLVLVAIPLGPLPKVAGYALLGHSFASGSATIRRTEIVFGAGALVALLIAALLALPLINRALRPLRHMADAAGAIAHGDLQQRANLTHSGDEIGRLGDAFDTMVDRLQIALMQANESEERMRRFLSDASHELRTPLTVLRGMSEVLLRREAKTSPEFVGALRDMHEESVRLSRLVDDLLTLTRLDTGLSLHPEAVQLQPFLTHFVERYATAWPNRSIELDLEALDGSEAYVDPEALRRVVTNLVDNAARYSTPGEPITVVGGVGDSNLTVSIADRGPGLSEADAERVFERFYRGIESRSRHNGGTGLGLSIVRALVQQSGGQVHIDTAPDRGTIVSVSLPPADQLRGVGS